MRSLLLILAAVTAAPLHAQETEFVVVQGQALTADGRPPGRMLVFMRAGDRTDSAVVRADGTFTLVAPAPAADSVDVWLDAADRAQRRYFPPLVPLGRTQLAEPLRVVLVPRVWVVQKGAHAGTAAAIGVLEAFRPGEDSIAFSSFWWRHGSAYSAGGAFTSAWPAEVFPLPVAFRHKPGDRPITRRDSTNFWWAVEQLERDLGRDLFRPARLEELPHSDSTFVPDAVVVEVDRSLRPAGLGGFTGRRGRLVAGYMKFRDRDMLADETVVAHELMHVLGFGHTCSWVSLVASPLCSRARRHAGPHDAAHAELFFRVHELQRALDTTHGLLAASAGAQRFGVAAP